MSKYTPENPPSVEELTAMHDFFVHMAGEAESKFWEDLYWDMADVTQDVVAAWRGEIPQ